MRRLTPAGARRATRRLIDRGLAGLGYALVAHDPEFANALVDRSAALPAVAAELGDDNPRLQEIRRRYQALDWPACDHSRWEPRRVGKSLDLQYFRGDSSYVWHYRESRRVSELKFFVYLEDVLRRDHRGLVEGLGEDS